MSTALIGHTGFVGGTLDRAAAFTDRFNSATINSISGRHFDLIVCAGVSAVKYLANRDPDSDRAGIARLTGPLANVTADEFVLISTIDVYPDPEAALDEDAVLDPAANHAYGRHRLELERWVQDRFARVRIIRLPALFGPGLRKNALFDLLHDNQVGNINPAGSFQWYPTSRLWQDIAIARANGLARANLFPAPLPMSRIIDAFFPGAAIGPSTHPAPRYDLRTRHAELFGGTGGYVMGADAVLSAMADFVAEQRA